MVLKQLVLVNLGSGKHISSSLRENQPKATMGDLAERAYKMVVGSEQD
jgi:hypothetical protein